MNPSLRTQLLEEAARIGDQFLACAIPHERGIAWKSVQRQGDEIVWTEQETIYGGVCGISLFLLQLWKQTGGKQYRAAAEAGVEWLLASAEAGTGNPNSTLLTGRMSLPFTLAAFYRQTGRRAYLDHALRLVASQQDLARAEIFEFINGLSGTLLGLLHLYALSGEKWLLSPIDACTGRLLDGARHGRHGLYWDRSAINAHGLCGFSHGAAGIGFVLLELGHCLGNEAFGWAAEQAFRYEAQYYDPAEHNWADFRKGIFEPKHEREYRQAYMQKDLDFFTRPLYMNAWCHGAAGLGLTRVRAFELLGKAEYRRDAEAAIAATRQSDVDGRGPTFTLCHGSGGNADLFLEAYRVLGNPEYLDLAGAVARKALAAKAETGFYYSGGKHPGPETSLFMGDAGIGYFYLRLLDPLATPSLLAPHVPAPAPAADLSACPHLSLSLPALRRRVMGLLYPKTLHVLEQAAPHAVQRHFAAPDAPEAESPKAGWTRFVRAQADALPAAHAARVADAFRLESAKVRADEAIPSDTLLHYKDQLKTRDAERLLALGEEAFGQTVLALDADLALVETRWDWQAPDPAGPDVPPGEYHTLLVPTLGGVYENKLSVFARVVLESFVRPRPVADAVAEVTGQFDPASPEQAAQISRTVTGQVRQAVRSGFLLDPAEHPLDERAAEMAPAAAR